MPEKILIIDDEVTIRDTLSTVLLEEGYNTVTASNGEKALELMAQFAFDAVICDIRMPGMNGIEVLRKSKEIRPETPVLIITAYASIETAVEALREGASDYIIKPFILEDIILKVRKLFHYRELALDNILLRGEVDEIYNSSNIIGKSRQVMDLLSMIQKVSSSRGTVLITGESGTGKELVARSIHNSGPRKQKRFMPVNCCAIPETLLDSALFGHAKGAFTDAIEARKGLFEIADKGTLFLDEIGDLTSGLQTKLLRAIEEREILPVGSTEPVKVDIRLIAATHQDLKTRIREGTFREDLFYRLNVVGIHIPPLRERSEDVPLLADHFIRKYNKELNRNFRGAAPETIRILMDYKWRGNIRELENVIERSMIMGTPPLLEPENLPSNLIDEINGLNAKDKENLKNAVHLFEKRHIHWVLENAHDDKNKAADILGISLATLYRKLEDKNN
ncbi:MAG: sigma-54 dependent transcriptional regulator [bacterium]